MHGSPPINIRDKGVFTSSKKVKEVSRKFFCPPPPLIDWDNVWSQNPLLDHQPANLETPVNGPNIIMYAHFGIGPHYLNLENTSLAYCRI